ncbi:PREDICTED: probable peptide chain release factor C12orf65 homolog, mitochondrial [Ceratosolen solmsi marchali]|uniref:Probable peptide chain release factor C12orf65 homolog, mitochondrial n=1 Tax=Ceratosolen solmsi marchali TaxID=326594 RepID=A0AAJ6YMG1_9HYME|nr:PREDICTED: probable peptide chain release factor C12orf65 homolog, mitochondrial [Ceratosolen solmsi marchali]
MIPLTNSNKLLYISNNKNIFTYSYNLKSLKKHIDFSKVPKLNDQELEVQYVRGAGPGGQATNKTNNAVMLRHTPTGIIVKCHETRSQQRNKEIAEKILINKLDLFYNKEDAVENQEKRIMKDISLEKKRRQKKLAALKLSFKEQHDVNNS